MYSYTLSCVVFQRDTTITLLSHNALNYILHLFWFYFRKIYTVSRIQYSTVQYSVTVLFGPFFSSEHPKYIFWIQNHFTSWTRAKFSNSQNATNNFIFTVKKYNILSSPPEITNYQAMLRVCLIKVKRALVFGIRLGDTDIKNKILTILLAVQYL